MAAVVAHEVKNPIAGIRGALQVIASRMPAESRDKPVVGDIIARLDALNGIVHDLLVFARPRQLRSEPVDLDKLIRNTLHLLHRDPTFAHLEVTFPEVEAIARADAEQLQMVFTNVLMNAAQAVGGAGTITIRHRSPAARVRDHDRRCRAGHAGRRPRHRCSSPSSPPSIAAPGSASPSPGALSRPTAAASTSILRHRAARSS